MINFFPKKRKEIVLTPNLNGIVYYENIVVLPFISKVFIAAFYYGIYYKILVFINGLN